MGNSTVTIATAVIPVSPQHHESGIYQEAEASVKAQTIPTEFLTVIDHEGRGAAWARNKGTAQVNTPFVVWLDADDVLKPRFVEETIKVYDAGKFVYSDWVVNGLVINTPDCLQPFDNGQEHLVSVLLPVVAWRESGGFDETLDTLEDEAFFRHIASLGWCGVRCPEPLIEYRRHLGASLVNLDTVDSELQKQRVAEKVALFNERYGKHSHMTQDCGCNTPKAGEPSSVLGERQPNDVLVETLYTPQKTQGVVTGRLYPRAGMGKRLWVHEDDARSRPDMYRIIASNPAKVAPDVATVKRLAQEAIQREQTAVVQPDFETMNVPQLMQYAKEQGIEIVGTGARGRVTRNDLLAALA